VASTSPPQSAGYRAAATTEITMRAGVAVVWARGEFDVSTVPLLHDALVEAGAAGSDVWLEMSGVSFLDAAGVGAILRARGELAAHQCRLTVVDPSDEVSRLLPLTDLRSDTRTSATSSTSITLTGTR
jgi:anti-anti-sigma factor